MINPVADDQVAPLYVSVHDRIDGVYPPIDSAEVDVPVPAKYDLIFIIAFADDQDTPLYVSVQETIVGVLPPNDNVAVDVPDADNPNLAVIKEPTYDQVDPLNNSTQADPAGMDGGNVPPICNPAVAVPAAAFQYLLVVEFGPARDQATPLYNSTLGPTSPIVTAEVVDPTPEIESLLLIIVPPEDQEVPLNASVHFPKAKAGLYPANANAAV